MKDHLDESTRLLYNLAAGIPYNPPSYTCIREFSDNFIEYLAKAPEYTESPTVANPEWQPELPYPKIYTNEYKKTILSIVKTL